MISNSQINEDRCNEVTTVWCIARHRGSMRNKDRPLVDRHAPKKGVGWLVNTQEQKVSGSGAQVGRSNAAHFSFQFVPQLPWH